ncbi:MAG: SNF2 helicase-associated domain-containing protein [Myxococcota bacterium]
MSSEEIELLLAADEPFVLFKGQWVEVDREKLEQALEHWEHLRDVHPDGQLSFVEGMRLLACASEDLEELECEEYNWSEVVAGKAIRDVLKALLSPESLGRKDIPNLKASLRY